MPWVAWPRPWPVEAARPPRSGLVCSSLGHAEDAHTAIGARAYEGPTAATVRALYRRYRRPARRPRLVSAAARPGISCHSAARRALRRRVARIFLTDVSIGGGRSRQSRASTVIFGLFILV